MAANGFRAGLTPDQLLGAYAAGIFPMAEGRGSAEIFWVDPHQRGVMPLDGFHISRSLARRIRRGGYSVTADRAFAEVVQGCADRPQTWINHEISELYAALFMCGAAHSVEVWNAQGDLIGGTYGVTIAGAWFGESMFSRTTDASKLALAHLVTRLGTDGFCLFDTQFLTPHLASLGVEEIPRAEYRRRLADALQHPARFQGRDGMPAPL